MLTPKHYRNLSWVVNGMSHGLGHRCRTPTPRRRTLQDFLTCRGRLRQRRRLRLGIKTYKHKNRAIGVANRVARQIHAECGPFEEDAHGAYPLSRRRCAYPVSVHDVTLIRRRRATLSCLWTGVRLPCLWPKRHPNPPAASDPILSLNEDATTLSLYMTSP